MVKETVDLLIKKANELVTVNKFSQKPAKKEQMNTLGLIRNGAIAVHEGKIAALDETRKIEQNFKSETVINASGKTVMPGFVDSHTHLVFAGAREEEFESRLQGASYIEILAKGGGILKTVNETRKASKEQLIGIAKQTLDTMLAHGTTTVEAKSGYGLDSKNEVKCLEAAKELNKTHQAEVVSTFLGAHAVPLEYEGRTEEYVNLLKEEMIPKIADRRLAEFCDVFCEKGVFNVEQTRKILNSGKKHGLKPKIHADELTSFGGAELAAEVNAVSAEHLLFASEKGLKKMAEKEVVAVLLPTASFSLMMDKYADARKMINLNVPIALGTDFNPSCWTENMQIAIAFACRKMRLTPAEAITAATINAAHSVNRAEEIGSLERGKKADIIILNMPNHKFLGYRFGVNLVDKVVKAGTIVVDREKNA
ncbi:MAG: imidazolonepropionase [Candidatus Bathyarchaeia archaeon]